MRVLACGQTFAEAVAVLGLEPVDDHPDLVLVDLDDDPAVERAASIPPDVPRIAVVGADRDRILRAAGSTVPVALTSHPAAIGPLVAAITPAPARSPTRVIVVTGVAGGVGRTLLAVDLAVRLAAHASVLVLDATGTGAAGRWLGLAPGSWSDLEGLVDELTAEHIEVVASERERIRLIGATGAMPSPAVMAAAARVSRGAVDVVLVDAPSLVDERTRAVMDLADRILVVASEGAAASGLLDGVAGDDRTWIIASRTRGERLGHHPVMRSLPDDPASIRAAERARSVVGGALGRAYDDLAELLLLDLR